MKRENLILGILFITSGLVVIYPLIIILQYIFGIFRNIFIVLIGFLISLFFTMGVFILIPSKMSSIILSVKALVKPKPKPKGVEIPATVRIASTPFFRPLSTRFARYIERDMELAGVYEHPQYFISAYLLGSLILIVVLTPLSIYLAIKINPILSFLLFIPLIVLIIPKFNLVLKKAERKDSIRDELPFFTAYAMIYQAVGKPFSEALTRASQTDVFKQIRNEGGIVNKHLRMGEDDATALSLVSRMHPNENFRTLLLGYTSVLTSGGDLTRYLETKLKDFIQDMKFRWEKYVEDSTNISEVTLMLLFIFPTLVLAGAFILPGQSLMMVNLFSIFVIPVIFVLMFVMASANQPKTYDIIKIPVVIPAVAGLAISVPLFLLGIDKYIVVSAGITVFAAINGVIAFRQLSEIDNIDNALPRFLRDVTEYRKMGYDLVNAIIVASEEVKYGKHLDGHLSYIASQLKLGRSMDEVVREVGMHSYLEKISFNLLATGIEEGEIKPSQLETLIDFITTVNRVKRETKAKLRLNTLISFMAPVGLILTTYLIAGVMTYFTSTTGMLGFSNQTLPAGQLSGYKFVSQSGVGLLIDSAKAMMISSSLGIGLLAGKISDFTAKSTVKLAIVMAITVVSLIFGNVFTSIFMKALMGGFG